MEAILQEHNNAMPARDVLAALAEKFRCVTVPVLFFSILMSIRLLVIFNMLLKSGIKFMLLFFVLANHQTAKARLQYR